MITKAYLIDVNQVCISIPATPSIGTNTAQLIQIHNIPREQDVRAPLGLKWEGLKCYFGIWVSEYIMVQGKLY